MQFHNSKEFDLGSFNLTQPLFDTDHNIFISKLSNANNESMAIKSDSLRLLSCNNDILQVELLHSSNSFYKFINDLDAISKEQILKNGTDWFGNSLNADTINNIFKRSVHLPVRLPAFPTLDLIIDSNCKMVGKRRKKMSAVDLKANMEVELSFIVDGVYYYKNKCHLLYKVQNIRLLTDTCLTTSSFFGMDQTCNDNESNDIKPDENE